MPRSRDNKQRPTVGLALGAGGVRGLAHVGVLRELERQRIPIDLIAGTSIGALVGALYAAWGDSEKITRFILGHTTIRSWLSLIDLSWRGGFLVGKKLESFLQQTLADAQFTDLRIPLTVVATDLVTGDEVHITSGDVVSAVRASIGIAPVFAPVRRKKHLLADGGLTNPVPDDVVRRMGADVVIAVSLDNGFTKRRLVRPSIADATYRSLSVIRYHYSKKTLRTADVVIEPGIRTEELVGFNDFFRREKVLKNIRLGQKAAAGVQNQIRSLMRRRRTR